MKTTVIGSGKGENKNTAITATRPSIPNPDKSNTTNTGKAEPAKPAEEKAKAEQPSKINHMPVSTAFNDIAKTSEAKPETAKPEDNKPEISKTELRAQLNAQKPALNLDGTIKLVEKLYRRKVQREKLIDTIDTLQAFEVAQLDDADQTEANPYQKCELVIEDDRGREFKTSNSFIVNAVAKYVHSLCVDKLAEIEGEIFIP